MIKMNALSKNTSLAAIAALLVITSAGFAHGSSNDLGQPACGISISKSSLTFTLIPGQMSPDTVTQSVYNEGSSSLEFVYLAAGAWTGPSGNIDGYVTQWKHVTEDDDQYKDMGADRTAVSEHLPSTLGESLDIHLRVDGTAASAAVPTSGASQTLSYMGQCSDTASGPMSLDPSSVIHASQIESPEIPQDMADSNNEFAVEFYKQAVAVTEDDDPENIFFSPTSIMVAFSVLNEGARGNTAAEIAQVFDLEPDMATRHNATAHMVASISREDPHATLDMANAIWLADRFEPYRTYLDVAHETYLADVQTVDFTDADDGVKRINEWAFENTHGKIGEVIKEGSVGGDTAMVVTNAIYFKGTWVMQFPENATKESDFYKSDSESVSADFMNVEEGRFDYVEADGAKVLRMPYEGDRLSMLLILPDDADETSQLESVLSAEQMGKWIASLERQIVTVSVPKFEASTNYNLNELLIPMGVQDVFVLETADLTGIGPGQLYVESASHDAYVMVNEQGTEAAAVTALVAPPPTVQPPPPRFVADHPFLFAIYDEESGMILFMGKIVDPTA